ncbi:phage/plasmid primase, P4 family [Microbacterium sp. SL62]|uniref:DNA primase family protein n=1 Tax=Microbacterium sp. SL62 TaxID=2995139 RepID=UPI0022723F54|nr:phage/plasmid primase, P4 family [Microbacterium sp. SL62]MCY1718482.1 phage/plasmid primase, P4 family [Microbacterium sp. SL62]
MGRTSDDPGIDTDAHHTQDLFGFVPTSAETLTDRVVSAYLTSIVNDDVTLGVIRDEILQRINGEIAMENRARKDSSSSSPQVTKVQVLDEITVVRVLLSRFRIVAINLAGSTSPDETLLAMYRGDFGPDAGLYVVSDTPIAQLASEIRPSFTSNAIDSMLKRLRIHAEVVARTTDAHLVPVANGVFDHNTQELLPFSPDLVFLSKSPVAYNAAAANPIIKTPHGDTWDVESWIADLSEDEGVPELLWEILSAAVRPGVRWNKAAFLYSSRGNNGKGTFCELARNLLGPSGHASIPIADFGKPFALTELIHARAIIVDENSVGAFAKDLGDFKSVVTGDRVSLQRKFKDPVTLSFSGTVIQCVNDFPKSRDKSASYARRQLYVPFRRWFGNTERRYIKADYLRRQDVLEYVLQRALSMKHTEFSNPQACQDLLAQVLRENAPVKDWWEEFSEQWVWDLLPTAFLWDHYLVWFKQTHPSGMPGNRNDFASQLVEILSDSTEWSYSDPQKKHRPGQKMAQPEPLIAEYNLQDWTNSAYTGTDPVRRCTPFPLKTNYLGIARLITNAATSSPLLDDLAA